MSEMSKKQLIAGNWKMNASLAGSEALVRGSTEETDPAVMAGKAIPILKPLPIKHHDVPRQVLQVN